MLYKQILKTYWLLLAYGYKLVCVDDKFSTPFKTYLGEDTVYNFINSMNKESQYYSDKIKNILTKNL